MGFVHKEKTMVDSTPAPTKATDPTLGLATHIGAVVAGAVCGYLSTKLGITTDPTFEAEIAVAVGSLVTTGVHYLQAKWTQINH